jgi:FixJ family two-component response regulator
MNDFLNKPLRVELLQNALSQAWQALQTLESVQPVTATTPRHP